MSVSRAVLRAVSIPTVLALVAGLFGAFAAPMPARAVSPDIVISQIYGGGGNSGATLKQDYIELYNRGGSTVSIDGWSVQYGSAAGTTWQVTPLVGQIPAGEHYLVGQAFGAGGTVDLPAPDVSGTTSMSSTQGKVALVTSTTVLSCTVPNCDTATGVRDFVGYGAANDSETAPTGSLTNTSAALREANGATDTDDNSADFTIGAPNPRNCGEACVTPPPPTGCDLAATHQIAQVQGSGSSTPIPGTTVRVEGVVTADLNDANELGGFYIQDDTPDVDPSTSEGIFVASTLAADAGDRVLVSGTASESFGETRIGGAVTVDQCGVGVITPLAYDLPRPEGVTFEPVESMLLTFPEALSVTEHFQLGRFGEFRVSSDGRLFQPTDRVEPGAAAQAMLAENQRRNLLIDDGSNVQNPFTVPYLPAGGTLRIGDTTTGLTGVLGFGFSNFRLQPTTTVAFTHANARPAAPADVGGDITIASFNTLNYFTTLTSVNPNARGANSAAEFERQQAKEVAAIIGLDADILGLMEVENNGSTAVANLVDALNAATAPGTYAFITEPVLNAPNEFGGTFGTDAIKVTFIYRPAAVTPVGAAQSSGDAIFDRPPLIQTFELAGGSEDFTVAVNHFKSKNCDPASLPEDRDQGDGQSCFNARRILQAQALIGVLDTLEVPNPLIVGDLNAYTEEDPIEELEEAGYTGLSEAFIGEADRYSFVFDGFSGELDHALAGPDLLDNVTGATIWHINADEPLILDYNLDFGRDPNLYQANAYRSSDHDPLIVGLDLATAPLAPEVTATAGWGAVTVEWTADDGGSAITGYEITVSAGGSEVDSVSVGPGTTSHTFGDLTNGVTYTFEVVATNLIGSGPAGSAEATPFVPTTYIGLEAARDCPTFSVTNANDFPIFAEWFTNRGENGDVVVPADSTVGLDFVLGRKTTTLLLFAGGEFQDVAVGRCAAD